MTSTQNKHAVVIGGSMGGLLTARVLSEHFKRVTVLERDPVRDEPESRKGQPHTRHLHGLLAEGFRVMTHYFPDLEQSLLDGGAVVQDMAKMMRWHTYGGYRKPFIFGTKGALMSRPFLEWKIRAFVKALPNVTMMDECGVENLLSSADKTRVLGVKVTERKLGVTKDMYADLVVDTSGRGSAAGGWLEALGYARPFESQVKVDVGYATRLYRRDPDEAGASDWVFITPEAPKSKRMGGAFAIEDNRWVVTVGGWHGEHGPADERGFLEFARSLSAPDVYDIITNNEPLSDIVLHKFPSSLRRHYEKLGRFPEGFLVLGDALCSFNPLYGQGMTSAALQAETLNKLLTERKGNLSRIAHPYFRRVAKVVDIPWQLAVGEDFRFPETKGKKAPGTDLINAYVAKVHRATLHDETVGKAFLKVMNLMAPPTSLFQPGVMRRVLLSKDATRRAPRHPKSLPG